MGFNRNIITRADIANLVTPGRPTPRTLDTDPPAGYVPPGGPGRTGTGRTGTGTGGRRAHADRG